MSKTLGSAITILALVPGILFRRKSAYELSIFKEMVHEKNNKKKFDNALQFFVLIGVYLILVIKINQLGFIIANYCRLLYIFNNYVFILKVLSGVTLLKVGSFNLHALRHSSSRS